MHQQPVNPLLVILGPTASGKTTLAANLAARLGGEILSADSRQIYRGMNLGTGKDLSEYQVSGSQIPLHLVDMKDAGYKYNVFEYQTDFLEAYQQIRTAGHFPIMCGGSGMYIEAVLGGYRLVQVPVNETFRASLEGVPDVILEDRLKAAKNLHNKSDTTTRKRLIRALEIAEFERHNPDQLKDFPHFDFIIAGINFPRTQIRERITTRLRQRLDDGMIEEVKDLMNQGVSSDDLVYYGLEYKFIALHLTGTLSFEAMVDGLNTAIHQFAKRQMTWFRKMERSGYRIHWIDGELPLETKLEEVIALVQKAGIV